MRPGSSRQHKVKTDLTHIYDVCIHVYYIHSSIDGHRLIMTCALIHT